MNLAGIKDNMEVEVVEVTDAISFFITMPDDPNMAVVNEKMAAFNAAPSTEPLAKPKKGDIIAGTCVGGWGG